MAADYSRLALSGEAVIGKYMDAAKVVTVCVCGSVVARERQSYGQCGNDGVYGGSAGDTRCGGGWVGGCNFREGRGRGG